MVRKVHMLKSSAIALQRFCSGEAQGAIMAIDTDRIDDCVLALLLLGRHDGQRVWKSFD